MKSKTVEPPGAGKVPPSTSISNCPSSWVRTSSALAAAGIPLRLALVAVTGLPNAPTRRLANGASGHRTPMPPVPAVNVSDTTLIAGRTIVSGPGQSLLAKVRASLDILAMRAAITSESTSSKIGFLSGRPLISKMRRTALSLDASAPRPYAVSVGNPITPPSRRNSRI